MDLFCGRNFWAERRRRKKEKNDRSDKCLWRSLLYWPFLHHHHWIILMRGLFIYGFLSPIESQFFSALCFDFIFVFFFLINRLEVSVYKSWSICSIRLWWYAIDMRVQKNCRMASKSNGARTTIDLKLK